jgi:hypothetical protein
MWDEELATVRTEDSSSQGSMEPWDTTFNRATNTYNKRPKFEPPTLAGRVSGFGMSMMFHEYYKEDAKKRKERKSQMLSRDKSEVEELRQKVQELEAKHAI